MRGSTDVPVQIGWALCEGGVIDPSRCFRSYLAIDRKVAWSAKKVHGIDERDLEGAPRFMDLWPKIQRELSGKIMIAHGAATERRFLRIFPMHRLGPWLDSLQLARAAFPGLASYSLGDLCANLGLVERVQELCPDSRWHEALFDAVASLVLVQEILSTSGLLQRPASALDPWLGKKS